MKQILYVLGLATCLFCSAVWADTDAWCGGGSYDGYDRNTDRGAIGCPQVNNAGGATNVTASGAWLNGMLVATGSAPTVVYVYWGPNDGGTNKDTWARTNDCGSGTEGQSFATNVNISANTTYYYRFYATNDAVEDGWASDSASFLSPGPPVLNANVGAAPVGFATATLNGSFTAGGSANIKVFWGQNTNAWSGTNSLGTRSMGVFNVAANGLSQGTLYYYRCYGTNSYGEGWSDPSAFTTRVDCAAAFNGGSYDGYDRNTDRGAIGCPQVNNAGGATNVTASSAWLNGMLVGTGSASTVVYVYWGPNDGGTNKNTWARTNDFGSGTEGQSYTTNVNISANTTYYYRFSATNEAGDEGWASDSASFLAPGPPVLNANVGAAPVGFATATLNGSFTAGGSADIKVFWGQNTNAWSGTNSLGTRSMGVFNVAASGLSQGALYYYRCYGTNSYGEGWSDPSAFTTRIDCTVAFLGGSYDGYDRRDEQMAMLFAGGTIFLVR